MATFNQTGFQRITTLTASTALTIPAGLTPSHVIINVETQSVRIRMDGTAATSTTGVLIAAGGSFELMEPNANYEGLIRNIRIIEVAASAAVSVSYFVA